MAKDKNSNPSEEENKNEEETAESETEDTEETGTEDTEESTESEEEEEDESEHSDKEERDFDSEIEEEEKQSKEKVTEETDEVEEEDDDKPVTRKELRAIEKTALASTALTIALTLAESDKEARLIVAKWKNRQYPKGMTLDKQIKEAYYVTHGPNIVGQLGETKRALINRQRVNNNGAGSHRDAPVNPAQPKLDKAELYALEKDGFVWNAKTKRFEKKVRSGVVVRNPKTKRAELLRN